jgi:hypothetical protein
MTGLRLDWCSYEAAKYAVEHWHYSRTVPAGKLIKVGAWESGQFIGCVIFGRGANNQIGNPYKLEQIEVCELVRIALKEHAAPVSKIASIAIKMLKKQSPALRLIVSYADPEQNHNGSIYQAMNWIYIGASQAQREYLIEGKITHKRTISSKFGTQGLKKLKEMGIDADYAHVQWKHKYLYSLDAAMRAQILPHAKPYPKRGQGETDNAAIPNSKLAAQVRPVRSELKIVEKVKH